jgi:hypothetical protein
MTEGCLPAAEQPQDPTVIGTVARGFKKRKT